MLDDRVSPPAAARPFWRSLEEQSAPTELRASMAGEFDPATAVWNDEPSRRRFLQSLGATFALGGLSGCLNQPEEAIVPQVVNPEQSPTGELLQFATAMEQPGAALGLLVTSYDGRPIKIEGNPLHPASLGATDVVAQASILDLYDPDRSQVVRHRDDISTLGEFLSAFAPRLDDHQRRNGAGLRILTRSINSPTLLDQLRRLLERFPEAHWHMSESLEENASRVASRQAFGEDLLWEYWLKEAHVVLSLDEDFLGSGPDRVRLAREFAERRRPGTRDGSQPMLRLYVAESTPSLTGAAADHRRAVRPSQVFGLLAEIAGRMGMEAADWTRFRTDRPLDKEWLNAVVADLQQAGDRALIAVGAHHPPALHRLALALNARLGSLHRTLKLRRPNDRAGGIVPESFSLLLASMHQGAVETLLIFETNPAYDQPGSAEFAQALRKTEWSVHCGPMVDETAQLCHWHLPTPHYLESWSDCRHSDGTASIVQPLIAPLYRSLPLHEILEHALSASPRSAYQAVRDFWRRTLDSADFETDWTRALHDGVIARGEPEISPELNTNWSDDLAEFEAGSEPPTGLQLVFRHDPYLRDGRWANNAWLQELPRPFTTLTWGNAALISPTDADERSLKSGDMVVIARGPAAVRLPVVVVPGQTAGVCTLHLGYGRRVCGRNGTAIGVDVAPLQVHEHPWFADGATLQPTGEHIELAITQPHQWMENRDLIRTVRDQELVEREAAKESSALVDRPVSLYPEADFEGPQWGMSINLTACVGCQACVVACQAENNIPTVGPEQVRNGRRMHWLRIDTYYSGPPESPEIYHQPMLCMHCEHAPCEPVCPVAATTHSPDGLNEMTYNRCIGTRYCSNNCPYKVRRFNFLDYHRDLRQLPVLQLQPNPDVTVRSRGVMEKCTYCVQRIRRAGIAAKSEHRELTDGDVVTACQAACPTQAILFGNIADPHSRVTQAKRSPLDYGLLTELNTRPRTTYQAAVRNPNPALAPSQEKHA